jgi:BirA family biotin operon repressor/biotin-[acetyl-CoA-carboxylase] ligase
MGDLPLLVIAAGQTKGRGRTGSHWLDADRALAVSLAVPDAIAGMRPLSLMAGVAVTRVLEGVGLKWPNDVMIGDAKVGGILVERSAAVTVIGLGLNLWWESIPEGMGAVYQDDPGESAHAEIGALWGAETMELIDDDGWPVDEYRRVSVTIGREVIWEPEGRGRAVDIAEDGALIVAGPDGLQRVRSGEIHHLRHQ